MVSILELKSLVTTAEAARLAYEQNADQLLDSALLSALEVAERAILDFAPFSQSLSVLFEVAEGAISLAEKAAGGVYKGQPYEIGKAKRQIATEIAVGIRSMLVQAK